MTNIAKITLAILGISFLLNVATWVTVIWFFPKDSPTTVLHYTSGVGIDFIGSGWKITYLPIMGAAFLLGNAAIGFSLKKISPEGAWLLWGTLPVNQLIILTAILLIRRLNI